MKAVPWSRTLKTKSKIPGTWAIAILRETRELREKLALVGGNRASLCCLEGRGGNGAPTTLAPWLPRAGTGAGQPHTLTLALQLVLSPEGPPALWLPSPSEHRPANPAGDRPGFPAEPYVCSLIASPQEDARSQSRS